jgi:hypothetical protein
LIDPDYHNYFQRIQNIYQIGKIIPLPVILNEIFEISDECSVCLSNFSESEMVMKPLTCQHCAHENCMMQWIKSDNKNNRKCPLCRTQIETILKTKN